MPGLENLYRFCRRVCGMKVRGRDRAPGHELFRERFTRLELCCGFRRSDDPQSSMFEFIDDAERERYLTADKCQIYIFRRCEISECGDLLRHDLDAFGELS